MNIHFGRLLKATIPAIPVFLLIDALVEIVAVRMTGVSLISYFEQSRQCRYGIRFHAFNFLFFSAEMLLVMFVYALIRLLFASRTGPLIITILLFLCFTGLFFAQVVNLGIYPAQPALLFSISTLTGFPVAVVIGAAVYENASDSRSEG